MLKEKKLIVELDMDLKFLLNIYFMVMRKLFNEQREHAVDAADGNVKESFKMFKIKSF